MNVWDSLRRVFGAKEAPQKLRNKAGGMAWIKGCDAGDGDHVLNGRAVRTVKHMNDPVGPVWIIDPPQFFEATENILYVNTGQLVGRGDSVRVIGLPDELLEPWKGDDVSDGEVRELYAPAGPREILALPVLEMTP